MEAVGAEFTLVLGCQLGISCVGSHSLAPGAAWHGHLA